MENVSLFLIFVAVCMAVGEAHRHHLDHHGKHHKEAHHGKHFKPHTGHDLKVSLADLSTPENETITIDVTRRTTGPNNEITNIKVKVCFSYLCIEDFTVLKFPIFRKYLVEAIFVAVPPVVVMQLHIIL